MSPRPKIVVDEKEASRRLVICRSCDHFKPKTAQCNKCNCFMKLKTKLRTAQCPIGKW